MSMMDIKELDLDPRHAILAERGFIFYFDDGLFSYDLPNGGSNCADFGSVEAVLANAWRDLGERTDIFQRLHERTIKGLQFASQEEEVSQWEALYRDFEAEWSQLNFEEQRAAIETAVPAPKTLADEAILRARYCKP